MKSDAMRWTPLHARNRSISGNDFRQLLTGDISCIIIEDFYSIDLCDAVTKSVLLHGLESSYHGANTIAHYSGLAAAELRADKDGYFRRVPVANQQRQALLYGKTDPLDEVMRLLRSVWPAGAAIATDEGRFYFAGIIRNLSKGSIHNDFAPRFMSGWSVDAVRHQFSWNLFLQCPEYGGEFEVWDRRWSPDDEIRFKFDSSKMKGYSEAVVKDCESLCINPVKGCLVLFDSVNYHTVHESTGGLQRLTMSSFVGALDEDSPLVLWS